MDPAELLSRLDEIGRALERSGHAWALLALGSVGLERERLDAYSDLDFFAVVEPGYKTQYIEDLDWLTAVAPVAFSFRNTPAGHKLLYTDGIFCEFAVFEPDELQHVPFAAGRVVWVRDGVDVSALQPGSVREPAPVDVEREVGEALTNLYVGLGRFRRGEKLSAARLVQGAAVDRILALAASVEPEKAAGRDPFAPERRAEQRFPVTATQLAHFVQGYERTPQSARAILTFLEDHFTVEPAMKAAILALC
jgi:hypothetical protein